MAIPQAARWCDGCHDPVLLLGRVRRPNYDDVNDPTSQAGIACTVVPFDHRGQQHSGQCGVYD